MLGTGVAGSKEDQRDGDADPFGREEQHQCMAGGNAVLVRAGVDALEEEGRNSDNNVICEGQQQPCPAGSSAADVVARVAHSEEHRCDDDDLFSGGKELWSLGDSGVGELPLPRSPPPPPPPPPQPPPLRQELYWQIWREEAARSTTVLRRVEDSPSPSSDSSFSSTELVWHRAGFERRLTAWLRSVQLPRDFVKEAVPIVAGV